jgi:Zn-dependent protease
VALVALALYSLRHSVGQSTVLVFVVVIPSIILHEISHGVVALACGDDTAQRAGRLTLNPLKHIDPIGTVILPAVLALAGFGAFGYAKPVPISPRRMRHPRNDSVLVSLAGPATNLALAGLSIAILRLARPPATVAAVALISDGYLPISALSTVDQVLYLVGFLNVSLAVFNMIPLPPLDGSAIVERLLPASAWPTWIKVRTYAMPALLILVLWDPHQFLGLIFAPAEREWARVLTS